MKEILILILTLLFLGFLPLWLMSQSQEERPLDFFSEVRIKGHFEVTLEQGTTPSIRIEGKSAQRAGQVITEVNEGKLTIRYRKENQKWNWDTYPKLHLHLVYPAMEQLRAEGKIQLTTANAINVEDLRMILQGHVTGEIEVMVGKLEVQAEGITKLDLSGIAQSQVIELDGVGKIRALSLDSQTANVDLDGKAAAHVHVTDELRADIDGVSKLRYSGKPGKTNIQKDTFSGVSAVDRH